MDTTRWNKIKTIFNDACDQPPEERITFVKNACAGDVKLETEILDLLRADEITVGFLDSIQELKEFDIQTDKFLESGTETIGPYKVIRELGKGGMGIVYLVERSDKQFKKQMALKLVKRGMDTDEILLRFRHERQILASLEHPNIARLHDGGATDDGRPYLVMEYVEGEAITTYCDKNKLSIEDRLKLFVTVCKGVQFAHQHLIVHRDLKPSNVLVTRDGDVRLLDFGIAKLLHGSIDEEIPHTRPLMRFITPAYASPEQLKGERITTASDVYSLGLLLYELLTGSHPHKDKIKGNDTTWIEQLHRFDVPSKRISSTAVPEIFERRRTTKSYLLRSLKGDLDNILSMSLHPDQNRRYQSAEKLLQDIERHLTGHPVSARPNTTAYRVKKFVNRNRATTVSAALTFILTIFFVVFTWIQHSEIARERDVAQTERDKAQEVSTFLENLLSAADPAFGTERADTLRIKDFVTRSTELVRRELSVRPPVKAQMLNVLGNVHHKLGVLDQSHALLNEALSMRIDIFGENHPEVAESKNDLGVVLGKLGNYDTAEKYIREALEMRRSTLGTTHADVVGSITDLANILHSKGDYDEAEELYREALTGYKTLYGNSHRKTASAMANLATIMHRRGELTETEELHRQALAIYEELFDEDHPAIANSSNNLGVLLSEKGKYDDAEVFLLRALTLRKNIYGETHSTTLSSMNNLAALLADKGNYDDAEVYYRRSLNLRRQVHGENSMEVAIALNNLADLLRKKGSLEEAITKGKKAVSTAIEAVGSQHPAVGIMSGNLASNLRRNGSVLEAEHIYGDALDLLVSTLPPDHPSTARVKIGLGDCLVILGRYEEAESLIVQGYTTLYERGAQTESARESVINLYEAWNKPDMVAKYRNTGTGSLFSN